MQRSESLTIEPLTIANFTNEENRAIERIIEQELISWEGTKHWPEMQVKGKGVDCARFIAAEYDYLTQTKHNIKTLPQDIAFHDRASAIAGMKALMSLYPNKKIEGMIVQPGDLVICGPHNGGPGHGMVVGIKHLWHCSGTVCRAGLSFGGRGSDNLKEIRRLKNRQSWRELCIPLS